MNRKSRLIIDKVYLLSGDCAGHTDCQPTVSSRISCFILWICALGRCPVVGHDWLQSSAAHRIQLSVAKHSDSVPSASSLQFLQYNGLLIILIKIFFKHVAKLNKSPAHCCFFKRLVYSIFNFLIKLSASEWINNSNNKSPFSLCIKDQWPRAPKLTTVILWPCKSAHRTISLKV